MERVFFFSFHFGQRCFDFALLLFIFHLLFFCTCNLCLCLYLDQLMWMPTYMIAPFVTECNIQQVIDCLYHAKVVRLECIDCI